MDEYRQRSQALRLSQAAELFAQSVPGSEPLCRVVSGVLRAVADGLGAGLHLGHLQTMIVDAARAAVADAVDERHRRVTPVSSPELPTVLIDLSELDEDCEPTRRMRGTSDK